MRRSYNLDGLLKLYGGRDSVNSGLGYHAAVNGIVPVAEKVLSNREYDALSYRLGFDDYERRSLKEVADIMDVTPVRVGQLERRACSKLKAFKEQGRTRLAREELMRTDLESCVKKYAPGRNLSELGKEGYAYLSNKLGMLEEKYGKGVSEDALNIVREAYVVSDFYRGVLSEKLIPLSELGFSIRAYNTLSSVGVKRAEDITRFSANDLMRVRNFGRGCLYEVQGKLAKMGLELKE